MKWDQLLALVAEEPVFSSGLLLSGEVAEPQVRLQLSRWVKAGRLVQLRRGLYCLAPPWQKVAPHPFLRLQDPFRKRPGRRRRERGKAVSYQQVTGQKPPGA